jgi:hypothetical protein
MLPKDGVKALQPLDIVVYGAALPISDLRGRTGRGSPE